jgi:uncharacterized protein involved in type VI secretion and phage assembly
MDGDFSGHLITRGAGLALGQVTDNKDPEGRGRIKLNMLALDVEIWASVVVPSAGQGYGVACLPKLNEIVLVAFLTPEQPFVIGAVWSGGQSEPAKATPAQDRYSITMPSGMAAVFDDQGGPNVTITTPAGNTVTLTDGSGGQCSITIGTTTLQVTATDIDLTAASQVKVNASTVSVSAATVNVDAGMAKFSGVVQCDTLIANSVVGTSYTPGAGNIW